MHVGTIDFTITPLKLPKYIYPGKYLPNPIENKFILKYPLILLTKMLQSLLSSKSTSTGKA